jgi:hypothetical protein
MDKGVKNGISHRGRSLALLRAHFVGAAGEAGAAEEAAKGLK